MIHDERGRRPLFDKSTPKVHNMGLMAIKNHDVETSPFCVLEAERRARASEVYPDLLVESIAADLFPIPWIEEALEIAQRFHGGTDGQRSICVVLLSKNNGVDLKYSLYVGQTGKSPDERFEEHKAGYKASRHVKRHGVCLLPRLFQHLHSMSTAEANGVEAELAIGFADTGIHCCPVN